MASFCYRHTYMYGMYSLFKRFMALHGNLHKNMAKQEKRETIEIIKRVDKNSRMP